MENNTYKEIQLPEHEKATGMRICHECHGNMNPCTHEHIFNLPHHGAKVKVSGIQAYKCAECGELVYSAAEAELIETAIKNALSRADDIYTGV